MRNAYALIKIIHEILDTRHGEPYATNKASELEGMNELQIIHWAMVHLDATNSEALRDVMGLTADEWEAAYQVMYRATRAHALDQAGRPWKTDAAQTYGAMLKEIQASVQKSPSP